MYKLLSSMKVINTCCIDSVPSFFVPVATPTSVIATPGSLSLLLQSLGF
nr:MAG TPA: hypothetical protein [Caudoviricetes sp.]